MNPLKDCSDYYLTAKLYNDTDSFTLNDLYESLKTQIKEELENELCAMLENAVSCPKCHKIHYKSGECGCGLEIKI